MTSELVKRLLALNREFYSRFASDFADSRSSTGLNLVPILAYFEQGQSILDAGCGNGRLAWRLEQEHYRVSYLGIDSSPRLLAEASKRAADLHDVMAGFIEGDVSEPGWTAAVEPNAPFDLILALAVMHHLPGRDLRRRFLEDLRSLLRPRGTVILSNWQFLNQERLRRKIVPWPAEWSDGDPEPGDALIDWKRGGAGLRYVHLIEQAELKELAAVAGFKVQTQFLADGDLNLYSILK